MGTIALDGCVSKRLLLIVGTLLVASAGCDRGAGVTDAGDPRQRTPATQSNQAADTHRMQPYTEGSATNGRHAEERDDLTSLVERVTLFCDMLSRGGSGTAGAMGADDLARLLAQLDNANAVQRACEAVLGRLVSDDDGLVAVLNDLLERPLTSWEVNTVHQMIAMIEIRQARFDDAVRRIDALLGPTPDLHTPKLVELLIVQANAYRGLRDRTAYEAVLQRIVDIATQLGKPYAAQKKAELARLRGEAWDHLDPAYAARLQSRATMQQRQEQEQLDYLARLPYRQRRHAVPTVVKKMEEQLISKQLTPSQRQLLSASYTRLLHVLNQPD